MAFRAIYRGVCSICGGTTRPGDLLAGSRGSYGHAACHAAGHAACHAAQAAQEGAAPAPAPAPDQQLSEAEIRAAWAQYAAGIPPEQLVDF